MKKNNFFPIILCVSMLFFLFFTSIQKAKAALPVIDSANLSENILTYLKIVSDFVWEQKEKVIEAAAEMEIEETRILALVAERENVVGFLGQGEGLVIRDYNQYLYVAPQEKSLAEMNTFFDTTSKGRLSYLNYQGLGPNYDSYLKGQATKTITGEPFSTDLQEVAPDPNQLFSTENMKGIMAWDKCPNNVACYSLVADTQYEKAFAKNQELAQAEEDNGFKPEKDPTTGLITKPSALAEDAFLKVDEMGQDLIMAAGEDFVGDSPLAADAQIYAGLALDIVDRADDYGLYGSTWQNTDAPPNQTPQFPFGLGDSVFKGGGVTMGQ